LKSCASTEHDTILAICNVQLDLMATTDQSHRPQVLKSNPTDHNEIQQNRLCNDPPVAHSRISGSSNASPWLMPAASQATVSAHSFPIGRHHLIDKIHDADTDAGHSTSQLLDVKALSQARVRLFPPIPILSCRSVSTRPIVPAQTYPRIPKNKGLATVNRGICPGTALSCNCRHP
jgi:hypothetical protein